MRYITALTIAGSDSCGGAGVQADIKTMEALGVYATSAITSVTAQNTMGVDAVEAVSPEMVERQIEAVAADMVIDAVKVGMLANAGIIRAAARAIRRIMPCSVVVDPVMVSTSGHALLAEDAVAVFISEMLPLATLLTPNLPEAERLSGITIHDAANMDEAAAAICRMGCANVLIKGGHLEGKEKTDILYIGGERAATFSNPTIETRNTHGTGCTLSSAIASFMARGENVAEAVAHAVEYLHKAIYDGRNICQGKGHGPVCHHHVFRCADDNHAVKRLSGVGMQFICHDNGTLSYAEGAELALKGGCRWVQLRMKDATDDEFIAEARKVRRLCTDYHATFIIDDRVHLVNAVGADGVHLGLNDMTISEARRLLGHGKIIGGTANTIEDVERHFLAGADYIGCGPFRYTTTKKNLSAILGTEGYKSIIQGMKQRGIPLPIVAIGGILPTDVADIIATGVSGIAVSGAVLNASDPVAETEKFINSVSPYKATL